MFHMFHIFTFWHKNRNHMKSCHQEMKFFETPETDQKHHKPGYIYDIITYIYIYTYIVYILPTASTLLIISMVQPDTVLEVFGYSITLVGCLYYDHHSVSLAPKWPDCWTTTLDLSGIDWYWLGCLNRISVFPYVELFQVIRVRKSRTVSAG